MNDGTKRIIRTVLQMVARGALYALTDQIAADLPGEYAPYIILGYTLLVTIAQNALESLGSVTPILKPDIPAIRSDAYQAGLHDATPAPAPVRRSGPPPDSE